MANSARGSQRKASPGGFVASIENTKPQSKLQMPRQGRSSTGVGGPKDGIIDDTSEAEQTQFRADRHFAPGGLSSDTNEWSHSRDKTETVRNTGNLPSGEQDRQRSAVEQILGGSSQLFSEPQRWGQMQSQHQQQQNAHENFEQNYQDAL